MNFAKALDHLFYLYFTKYRDLMKQEHEENINEKIITFDILYPEIKNYLDSNHIYMTTILGSQGSGKTSIAKYMAEFLEKENFEIIYLVNEDIFRLEEIAENLKKSDREYCLIVLDDLSYYISQHNTKRQAKIKNQIARIRHIFSNENIQKKVFLVYVTHRLHGTPPIMRNVNSYIITSYSYVELDDLLMIIKHKELRKNLQTIIAYFREKTKKAIQEGIMEMEVGDHKLVFEYNKQGRIALFFDLDRMKILFTPKSDFVFKRI